MYSVEEHSSQRVPGALRLPFASQLVPVVRLSSNAPKVLMTQNWGILPSNWREYCLTNAVLSKLARRADWTGYSQTS